MPPLPKKKHSRARRGNRASHFRLAGPGMASCPTCRSAKLPHRVCKVCGNYRDRQVIDVTSTEPSRNDQSSS